jgi:hypothetical protein
MSIQRTIFNIEVLLRNGSLIIVWILYSKLGKKTAVESYHDTISNLGFILIFLDLISAPASKHKTHDTYYDLIASVLQILLRSIIRIIEPTQFLISASVAARRASSFTVKRGYRVR